MWFEFLLLLVMLLTCFTNAFDRARSIFLSYLSMVTVLLTLMARAFIANFFTSTGAFTFKDYQSDASNAAAAGAVLLCICNFALIIFVGLGHKPNAGHGSGAPVPLSALGEHGGGGKAGPAPDHARSWLHLSLHATRMQRATLAPGCMHGCSIMVCVPGCCCTQRDAISHLTVLHAARQCRFCSVRRQGTTSRLLT